MSSAGSASKVVITQLVVDASGARTGVAEFEAALDKARDAAANTGGALGSFDNVLKKWTQSLASTDPVLKAQVAQQQALNRQLEINKRAVELGIATQDAANAQLDRVNQKYGAYVRAAQEASQGTSKFGQVVQFSMGQVAGFVGVMSAERIVAFGKELFEAAAGLNELADQAGVSTEALQAYRAVLAQNGIEAAGTDQIFGRLTRAIGEARTQAGPARDAFNQLGISFGTLKGGAEQTLPALARALLAIPDASQRASLEVDILGKKGQQLESALRALVDPTATVIEKQRALGMVLGHDVTDSADMAADRLSQIWTGIKNEATPAIVGLVDRLIQLNDWMAKIASGAPTWAQALLNPGRALLRLSAGLPINAGQGGTPAQSVGKPYAGPFTLPAANDNGSGGYSTAALDEYIAKQRLSASIAQMGPVQQAQTNMLIEAANTKLASGAGLSAQQLEHFRNSDGSMRKFVTSAAEATDILGQAKAHEVQGLAATIARGAQWNKLRETFDGYLNSLGEEARIAGESNAQRNSELAVIKGAQIAQRERGDQEKDLVKTYDQALQKLSAIQVAEIERREAAKITAALENELTDQLGLANVALESGRDDRELALAIAQKQLQVGRELTEQEKQQLALIQQKNDAAHLRDYLAQLKDEASLAGLSADERERQAAVLEAMRITHGQLTDAQADEIRGIIESRQETERWRQVVDGIADSFQGFFEDLANKGAASFGDLARAIKAQFVQLLAWMASQALIQPIIVPMVGEMAGAFGMNMPAGIGGGLLGGAGPLGGVTPDGMGNYLAGGAGLFGGLGGAVSSLGSFLGFGTAGTAGTAVSLGSISGAGGAFSLGSISTATPALPGSLFGTTLGGFLGGAGLGALASNLIFGNKNSAGLGGMGGAAAGALIGSIIPGVGTIIGGLAGGLLGGGLGSMTGTSNQGAIANFTNGGAGSYLFKQGGGNNGQLSTQAAKTVSDAIATLHQAGVDVSLGNITGLSIGSDKSYVYDSAGGKQKLAGGDAAAVAEAILTRILPSASGTTTEAQAILGRYQANGGINAGNLAQLEKDLGAAKNFADALKNLKAGGDQLSQIGQQLKQINDQYDQLVDQAQQLGLDISSLTDARDGAIARMVEGFNGQVSDAISQLADPTGYAFDQLVTAQKQRLADAQQLGADIQQVDRLATLEMQKFFASLDLDQLSQLAASRGLNGNAAYQGALGTAQAALQAANDNQILQQSFVDLGKSVQDLAGQAQDAAQAAGNAASEWGRAHDALSNASTALLISDQSLSPEDRYRNSAARFGSLRSAAFGGDVGAANDLAAFAGDFLKTSYSYNGSNMAYGQDLSYVQNTLNSLASFAGGQQSLAQQQANSAAQAVTVLQSIRQAISDQANANKEGLAALSKEVSDMRAEIKAGNLQARYA